MPAPNQFIFWGATGQAKVLRDCLKSDETLIALFDNNESVPPPFSDLPLFYGWEQFKNWKAQQTAGRPIHFLVAIGGSHGNERLDIHDRLEAMGLTPGVAIHPSAVVASSVKITGGSQVLASSTVCVESQIGRSCIINTAASVDHECILEDGVHICPGAHLAGQVHVGRNSMIGTGAVILPRVKIGKNSIVGAGAVVIEDVPNNVVVVGNPARILKERANNGHDPKI